MTGAVLTRREADVLACLLDAVAGARPPLPPPAATDAVDAFQQMLRSTSALNRVGLRALLWLVELAPLVSRRRRLRALPRAERLDYVAGLDRTPAGRALDALLALVRFSYYGDRGAMVALGYDADAVVARGRAVRAAEGRW